MNALRALIGRNSYLIFHTAIVLLYLIRSLKSDPDPASDLGPYKRRIFNSINTVRRLHGVQLVTVNEQYSQYGDNHARDILDGKLEGLYIPGENEENPPKSDFPLINRMTVRNMNATYAKKKQYNPIFQWYAARVHYPGYYDEKTYLKYAFYTQLIWKNSKEVGIGIAYKTKSDGNTEVVLHLLFLPSYGKQPENWDDNILPTILPVPPRIDSQILPTVNPLLEEYKVRILNSINKCRDIHGVPKVTIHVAESNSADVIATKILRRENLEHQIYIPRENENVPPTGYFPLVSRIEIPSKNNYGNEYRNNPIYQWYHSRELYKGYYDKDTLPQYGFYTQLIWKNSRQVAIGIAFKHLSTGKWEVVTYLGFKPEGNTPNNDEFTRNVLPPKHAVPLEVYSNSIPNPADLVTIRRLHILSLVNQVRELHHVGKLGVDLRESNVADNDAKQFLEGKIPTYPEFYVPGIGKSPDDYFELTSKMQVPNMSVYGKELQYNPIFKWYANRKYYPGFYDKNLHSKYGYYTQLIWKNSVKLIIGEAFKQLEDGTYQVVLMLDFWPHGNVPDQFSQNVLPAKYYIPPEVDPNEFPQLNPIVTPLKSKIYNSINRVRGLCGVQKVDYNIQFSSVLDVYAQAILEGRDKTTFVPGLNEDNLPEAYFPLVHKMVIPQLDLYATERKYNPAYQWFSNRRTCLYHYDKDRHATCGFFTQLVSRDSISIAVGIAASFNEDIGAYDLITYVEFVPPGNDFPDKWSNRVFDIRASIPTDIEPKQVDEE